MKLDEVYYMYVNLLKYATWNDIITYCATSMPKKITSPSECYIWDFFKTPDNKDYPFDRNSFFDYLILQCGDYQALSGNVTWILEKLKSWTQTRLRYWQRMYDALCLDYNPIYNYNRYDEETSATKRNKNMEYEGDSLTKVAGYDSGNLVENDSRNSVENSGETEEEGYERNNHSYGNIGVTSTQQMIEQELELCQHSMYDIILNEFKDMFCILVY